MVRLNLSGIFAGALLLATQVQAAAPRLRYMPLGDSITELGCWRAWVHRQLVKDGYDIDFVGSMNSSTNCNNLNYDRQHEGHSGRQAFDMVARGQLKAWLKANPADIITMHLGTNDIRYARNTSTIIGSLGTLIDQMRAANPKMKIIVAQIIPLVKRNKVKETQDLNKEIAHLVARKRTVPDSPIWLVDQSYGFNVTTDLEADNIHPNANGQKKMAERFYPAIVGAIKSLGVKPKTPVQGKSVATPVSPEKMEEVKAWCAAHPKYIKKN
ncbi:SGNH hydrolase-type esterase domain-containing protein [Podospora didyma]|uniref:SGNH hydrolase-type esterase domain-containing protein n=1 Tax=Podospora didyma TaxID=330526 RepID=A0AAE0NZ14_9PEZI|nr:SGNH hydrolase-type esterase domain-containing protein [Podospora didyma]